jgi:hypothetical protein
MMGLGEKRRIQMTDWRLCYLPDKRKTASDVHHRVKQPQIFGTAYLDQFQLVLEDVAH